MASGADKRNISKDLTNAGPSRLDKEHISKLVKSNKKMNTNIPSAWGSDALVSWKSGALCETDKPVACSLQFLDGIRKNLMCGGFWTDQSVSLHF
jgi:hypothetical protein